MLLLALVDELLDPCQLRDLERQFLHRLAEVQQQQHQPASGLFLLCVQKDKVERERLVLWIPNPNLNKESWVVRDTIPTGIAGRQACTNVVKITFSSWCSISFYGSKAMS